MSGASSSIFDRFPFHRGAPVQGEPPVQAADAAPEEAPLPTSRPRDLALIATVIISIAVALFGAASGSYDLAAGALLVAAVSLLILAFDEEEVPENNQAVVQQLEQHNQRFDQIELQMRLDADRFSTVAQRLEADNQHFKRLTEELQQQNRELVATTQRLQRAYETLKTSADRLTQANTELRSSNELLKTNLTKQEGLIDAFIHEQLLLGNNLGIFSQNIDQFRRENQELAPRIRQFTQLFNENLQNHIVALQRDKETINTQLTQMQLEKEESGRRLALYQGEVARQKALMQRLQQGADTLINTERRGLDDAQNFNVSLEQAHVEARQQLTLSREMIADLRAKETRTETAHTPITLPTWVAETPDGTSV